MRGVVVNSGGIVQIAEPTTRNQFSQKTPVGVADSLYVLNYTILCHFPPQDPDPNPPGQVTHSCFRPCPRKAPYVSPNHHPSKSCQHPCPLLCHPGPCPKCVVIVENLKYGHSLNVFEEAQVSHQYAPMIFSAVTDVAVEKRIEHFVVQIPKSCGAVDKSADGS